MNRPSQLHRLALPRPGLTLALWGAVCLAALPGLARLELRVDGRSLVPRDDPAVVRDGAIRQRFGLADPVAVVVTTGEPGGIYARQPLAAVAALTDALGELPGVAASDLVSLATEHSFRPRPGSLERRRLLEPLPESADELAELRSDLRRLRFDRGFLVSRDASAAAIYLQLPETADRRGLLTRIDRRSRDVLSRAPPGAGLGVDLVGAPVAEALLGDHLLADLGVPERWLELPHELRGSVGGPGLVPLVLLVIAGVFVLAFRRAVAVALPLIKVAAVLAVVLGAMGWLGVPIHLTTAILPVVLVVLAIADEIHLLRRARELAVERPDAASTALAEATLDSLALPVLRTSLTTAVGFLSFLGSPIVPIRWFGLWTAVGIAVAALWALTATPVLLALAGRRAWAPRSPRGRGPEAVLERGLGRLARESLARPRWTVAAVVVAVAVAGLGVARLAVHDSWSEGFDPSSPTARATARFEEGFAGAHLLLVELSAPNLAAEGVVEVSDTSGEIGERSVRLVPVPSDLRGPGGATDRLAGATLALEAPPWPDGRPRRWSGWLSGARRDGDALVLELPPFAGSPRLALRPAPGEVVEWSLTRPPFETPEVLRTVAELERFLEARPEVGAVVGPARTLETVFFMRGSGDEAERRLPRMPFEAEIGWRTFERTVGPERLGRVVDSGSMDAGLVTAFLRHADSDRVARLTDALDDFAGRQLEPAGLTVATGGDAVVSQALIEATVRTQLVSLALALLALGVAAWWIGGRGDRFGGWAGAAAVGAPPAFAVLLVFGTMGWAGIPLGVATSMFAGMTLGLGLDGAIHLHARFREISREILSDPQNEGAGADDAAVAAWRSVGPAILVDVAAVGLGFAVLTTSAVPANARLGALLVLALASTFVATLLFAPLLLAVSRRT